MTTQILTEFIYVLAFLNVFLLIGTYLRAKVVIFQKTFLPASVIGGFLALILGPIVLNIIPVPESWLKTFSLLPGILLVPIVAAVPLGLKFGGDGEDGGKRLMSVLPLICIMFLVIIMQYVSGFGTNLVFTGSGTELYETFGWELPMGFTGGHGSAGLLGNMLLNLNIPYWETAQGVAVTAATFGIIGGILLGMLFINIAARRGHAKFLKDPGEIPLNVRVGYEKDVTKQPSAGRETTLSSSIDVVAFHFAIVMAGCGIAYLFLNTLKALNVPGLSGVAVWTYAILVMFGIWWIMCKLKIDYLVDEKIKTRISSSLTELAVVSAIASLPVKAVMTYIVPILSMVLLGFLCTGILAFYLTNKYIKTYKFEHGIAVFGMCTGVFLTGLLLLRVCDPEFKSPVLANYSLAYAFTAVAYFAILQLVLSVILAGGVIGVMVTSLSTAAFFLLVLSILDRKGRMSGANAEA